MMRTRAREEGVGWRDRRDLEVKLEGLGGYSDTGHHPKINRNIRSRGERHLWGGLNAGQGTHSVHLSEVISRQWWRV